MRASRNEGIIEVSTMNPQKPDVSEPKRKGFEQIVRRWWMAFVAALIGGFLGWIGSHGLNRGLQLVVDLCSAAVAFLLCEYFTAHLKIEGQIENGFIAVGSGLLASLNSIRKSLTDATKGVESRLEEIEERLRKMIEHTALFTDTNRLEDHLALLRKYEGGLAWIVAKFISRKLSEGFAQKWTFEIEADQYSDFAAELYKECRQSIYLTSPLTPREWFEQLFWTKADRIRRIKLGEMLEESEIPAHAKALVAAQAPDKKRLVILSDERWKEVTCCCEGVEKRSMTCKEKYYLLKEFLRVNGQPAPDQKEPGLSPLGEYPVDTRFVKQSDIQRRFANYDLEKDYAIFNRMIRLKWSPRREGANDVAKKGPLELSGDIAEAEEWLIDHFTHRFAELTTGQELLNQLAHDLGKER